MGLGTDTGLKEEKRDGEGTEPGIRIGRRTAERRSLGIFAREAPSNLHERDHGDGKGDELGGVWGAWEPLKHVAITWERGRWRKLRSDT